MVYCSFLMVSSFCWWCSSRCAGTLHVVHQSGAGKGPKTPRYEELEPKLSLLS